MVIERLKLGLIPFQLRKLSSGLLVFIAMIFVWISADWVFGGQATVARTIMLIYFLMFLVVRTALNTKPSAMNVREVGLFNFVLVFAGSALILIIAQGLLPFMGSISGVMEIAVASVSIGALGFGILHGFIKAYIEEDVFRDALPNAGLGDLVSNVLFGLFHLSIFFTVYGFTLIQAGAGAVTLFILGIAWSQIRNNFGILGSTASHLAWNMFAMGTLGILIGQAVI
jgi:hypothetical protein